jgi:Domain of unknown function (DUF5919)
LTERRTGELVDLSSRANYRPDIAALARNQIASVRSSLELTVPEFAEMLSPLIGWPVTPEAVESWETTTVPPGDVLLAAGLMTHSVRPGTAEPYATDLVGQLMGDQFSDVVAVYASRSEFTSSMSPQSLFEDATDIRAAGLSLNLICQQHSDQRLRQLVADGLKLRCLFLDPAGAAIKAREHEEGYPAGQLSALTSLNIEILQQRVRDRLSPSAKGSLEIATYDETIRFNIVLIDGQTCIMQPYLPETRGVDSPTFLIQRRRPTAGLFPTFDQVFMSLWERSTQR